MDRVTRIAAGVIAKAGRENPADAVLRGELKRAPASTSGERGAISHAVFAYYRWLGWLDEGKTIETQIDRALELKEAFGRKPASFTEQELQRAIPGWLRSEMEVSAGWLRSLQAEPSLWLRARPGLGRELAAKLGNCRPGGKGALADALRYEGINDLFRTAEFHAGEFEVQDLHSQAVGLVCAPQPGETWWDACAGEGGKTLHVGDLMRNKGLVWASDRAGWRLQQLKRRAARARLFNYRAASWDGGHKLPTKTKFDGVLVDAPCSGVGTWHRNPHARWTTTPEDVYELARLQEHLVANAVAGLKPGGRLVYAVCTLTRAETTGVTEAIGRRFPELESWKMSNPLEPGKPASEALWLWPQATGGNGMYIQAWQKQAGKPAGGRSTA